MQRKVQSGGKDFQLLYVKKRLLSQEGSWGAMGDREGEDGGGVINEIEQNGRKEWRGKRHTSEGGRGPRQGRPGKYIVVEQKRYAETRAPPRPHPYHLI